MQLIAARTAAEQTGIFADRLALLEASLPQLSTAQSLLMEMLERRAGLAGPDSGAEFWRPETGSEPEATADAAAPAEAGRAPDRLAEESPLAAPRTAPLTAPLRANGGDLGAAGADLGAPEMRSDRLRDGPAMRIRRAASAPVRATVRR